MRTAWIMRGGGLVLLLCLVGVLSACGDTATTTPQPTVDPYAGLSARQVIDTYMALYQKGDYAAAHNLFSAGIRAANTVDEETLNAKGYITRYGPITKASIEIYTDQGAELIGLVRFDHTDPNGFEQRGFSVRRENNTWKIARLGF